MSNWFKPRTVLDPIEQIPFLKKVREEFKSNHWVTGYAGSGKSLLLLHCLLDEKAENPDSSVIIVLYTKALIGMIKEGIPNDYKNIRVVTYYEFRRIREKFDLILIDEVQDIPMNFLSLCNNRTTDSGRVIVAGDINQSIFDEGSNKEEIIKALSPNISVLNRIYRVSRTIRDISADYCFDKTGYLAADVMDLNVEAQPQFVTAKDIKQEYNYLWLSAKNYADAGYAPAILISNHNDIKCFIQAILEMENKDIIDEEVWRNGRENKNNYQEVNDILKENNLNVQYLGNGFGSFDNRQNENLVTIMTYHSAKGLDFKAVFIPLLNENYVIWRDYERAKSLFFVALTRSREQLIISCHGNKHYFLSDSFVSLCDMKSAEDELKRIENPFDIIENGDDDFINYF